MLRDEAKQVVLLVAQQVMPERKVDLAGFDLADGPPALGRMDAARLLLPVIAALQPPAGDSFGVTGVRTNRGPGRPPSARFLLGLDFGQGNPTDGGISSFSTVTNESRGRAMDTYLDSPIKEVIDRFPEVGTILDEYGVGCVTCGVGTCPVKDIISIHHLAPEDEQAVMTRIAQAITAAGQTSATPAPTVSARSTGTPPAEGTMLRYSPPLKQLVDEHTLIKRWLALIPTVLENLDLESADDRQLVLDGVDFIRSYADRLHHAKEEDILFTYYDADRPIIKIMLADHEQARGHARAAEQGVHERDREKVDATPGGLSPAAQ